MFHQEGDDVLQQMLFPAHAIRHSVAVVLTNYTTAEERFECVEQLHVTFVLHHGEFRQHLISSRHLGVRIDGHMKAAFAIHKADDPSCLEFHLPPTPNVKSLRILAPPARSAGGMAREGGRERSRSSGVRCAASLSCGLSPCLTACDCRRVSREEWPSSPRPHPVGGGLGGGPAPRAAALCVGRWA